MFRLREVTVFPQRAKLEPLKAEKAQKTKERDMQRVLPDLTAPSHIMASKSLYGLSGVHQQSRASCFFEKGLNSILIILFKSLGPLFESLIKGREGRGI